MGGGTGPFDIAVRYRQPDHLAHFQLDKNLRAVAVLDDAGRGFL